jgi:subtilase family serine protease
LDSAATSEQRASVIFDCAAPYECHASSANFIPAHQASFGKVSRVIVIVVVIIVIAVAIVDRRRIDDKVIVPSETY